MKGTVLIDDLKNAVDQLLALAVPQFAESGFAAQMIVIVSVTARTAERTFSCDFNREGRGLAS
jgi:hypothetical protein